MESDNLIPSSETIPPSDRKDQMIRELEALCRELVEVVHRLEKESFSEPKNERMIGRLEERIFTMTDLIHSKQRSYYLDEGVQISIAHTVDGLPIRVNKTRKVNLWGS